MGGDHCGGVLDTAVKGLRQQEIQGINGQVIEDMTAVAVKQRGKDLEFPCNDDVEQVDFQTAAPQKPEEFPRAPPQMQTISQRKAERHDAGGEHIAGRDIQPAVNPKPRHGNAQQRAPGPGSGMLTVQGLVLQKARPRQQSQGKGGHPVQEIRSIIEPQRDGQAVDSVGKGEHQQRQQTLVPGSLQEAYPGGRKGVEHQQRRDVPVEAAGNLKPIVEGRQAPQTRGKGNPALHPKPETVAPHYQPVSRKDPLTAERLLSGAQWSRTDPALTAE